MTARTAASKKSKGRRLEVHVAKRMTEVLGIPTRRMVLSGAVTGFESDIYTDLPLSIECKNNQRHNLNQEWKQTVEQTKNGNIPVLVMSENRSKEPLAVIRFEDLLFFLELALQAGWVTRKHKKHV